MMIEHIKVLNPSFADKNIYIWDTGRESILLFSRLAARGINIKGFGTKYSVYKDKMIMNRPVLYLEDIRRDSNALMISFDDIDDYHFGLIQKYAECTKFQKALILNPLLENASPYIYGSNKSIWSFLNSDARESALVLKGLLIENPRNKHFMPGVPIIDLEQAAFSDTDYIVVLQRTAKNQWDIIPVLQDHGFNGRVFLPEIVTLESSWTFNPYVMINQALIKHKRILFCCEDPQSRELYHRVFSIYNVPLAREVSYDGTVPGLSEDIWSLANEDPAESVVLFHSFNQHRRYEIVNAVNELGYRAEDHNYAATIKTSYNAYRETNILNYKNDDTLFNYSVDFSPIGGLPGWARFGNETDPGPKIMVLGGSTSSELFYEESWVSKLYKMIRKNGKSAVIYNGAHEANNVYLELNRMIRDIHALKPNIVISMSGFNNLAESNNIFDSVRNESAFQYWRRMESYMKLIAESEGAVYYAILQPINQTEDPENFDEDMLYPTQTYWRGGSFFKEHRSDDFYIDLFSKFTHQNEMIVDMCHYSNKGHEELAKEVYQLIKDKL